MATSSHVDRDSVVRIHLDFHPAISTDHKPEELPTLQLNRHPDGYAIYGVGVWDDEPVLEEHCSPTRLLDACPPEHRSELKREPAVNASSAWEWVVEMDYQDDRVLILVGPGQTPLTLKTPVFLPDRWQVWQADAEGNVEHVGDYLSRFSVLQVFRWITDANRCPIISTPYLAKDSEFDSVAVIGSSEVMSSMLVTQ